MACKDGSCQEEGDGDSHEHRFDSDPLLLFVFGGLVSPRSASVRGAETSSSTDQCMSLLVFSTEGLVLFFFPV